MRVIPLSMQQRRIMRDLKEGRPLGHSFNNPVNFSRSLKACILQRLVIVESGFTAEYRLTDKGREALRTRKYVKVEK